MENISVCNGQPDLLYHYTSLETLALILKNRTIRFNSLQNVDDIEEAETKDMDKFGRFVYVSCWTDDPMESIALWSLYTPNMHGVRIGLPPNPFKKFRYSKDEYSFEDDIETYIDYEKMYMLNQYSTTANQPSLEKITYTNDESFIKPKVKTSIPPNAAQIIINAKSMEEAKGIRLNYSFERLGRYKRKDWEFQHEWRYIITTSPIGLQEAFPTSFERHQEFIKRIEGITPVPCERLFLDLDKDAVKQMQILLGPRMSEAEKIYVRALLKEQGLEQNCAESKLKIR